MDSDSGGNQGSGNMYRIKNRRAFLKFAGSAAIAAGAGSVIDVIETRSAPSEPQVRPPQPRPQNVNPRWFGFNLVDYLTSDPGWQKSYPYESQGAFAEIDFQWIRDWGFTFVRLPTDYRFWTDPKDLFK